MLCIFKNLPISAHKCSGVFPNLSVAFKSASLLIRYLIKLSVPTQKIKENDQNIFFMNFVSTLKFTIAFNRYYERCFSIIVFYIDHICFVVKKNFHHVFFVYKQKILKLNFSKNILRFIDLLCITAK